MNRTLHAKLGIAVAFLMLLSCAAMITVVHGFAGRADQEAAQRLNLGLARYMLEHQAEPLLDARGGPNSAAMRALAEHVMAINPAVEVYLLSRNGTVLAHALADAGDDDPLGRRVDLAAVAQLLEPGARAPRLPVLGDDPRHPGRRSAVSVASVEPAGRSGAASGYLYVVLEGRAQRAVAARIARSTAQQEVAVALALVTAAGTLAAFFVLRNLTRPLRQLARRVESIRTIGAHASPQRGDEIAVLRAAVDALHQRVETQILQLEEAERHRKDLVGGISHDLRTPLASLRGYLETVILKSDTLDSDTREQYLRVGLRQAERIQERVGELFEMSKLDSGRVEPRLEVFCLAELLQDEVQGYQPAARERGITVQLAAHSHRSALVRADIAMIERVLQNLIDNALRFTPAGGAITLGIVREGDRFRVSVADTGRGIAPEHLPHVFERYWRSDDGEDPRSPASSGLGLAIVKRILEIHGSGVQVRSEPAAGTRFEFLLPQAA